MFRELFAPRNLAKNLLSACVFGGAKAGTDALLENHTELDTDNIVVNASTNVAAQMVSVTATPATDRIVDEVFDRVGAWKRNRKDRKNNPESE
jgi:hypothetical protein